MIVDERVELVILAKPSKIGDLTIFELVASIVEFKNLVLVSLESDAIS